MIGIGEHRTSGVLNQALGAACHIFGGVGLPHGPSVNYQKHVWHRLVYEHTKRTYCCCTYQVQACTESCELSTAHHSFGCECRPSCATNTTCTWFAARERKLKLRNEYRRGRVQQYFRSYGLLPLPRVHRGGLSLLVGEHGTRYVRVSFQQTAASIETAVEGSMLNASVGKHVGRYRPSNQA